MLPLGPSLGLLLIGGVDGLESDRGIHLPCADSLPLPGYLGPSLDASIPDHSTLSRTQTRPPVSLHDADFKHILRVVETERPLHSKVAVVDPTCPRADASMNVIVSRDAAEK